MKIKFNENDSFKCKEDDFEKYIWSIHKSIDDSINIAKLKRNKLIDISVSWSISHINDANCDKYTDNTVENIMSLYDNIVIRPSTTFTIYTTT